MELRGVDLLDGRGLAHGMRLRLLGDQIAEIGPDAAPPDTPRPLVFPGLVDLQVNGGGGQMLGDAQSVADMIAIAQAHRSLGTSHILPTLISDTPETTGRIIALAAAAAGRAGILGLHLEGPHLARAGAHDPAKLRPMTDADLHIYLKAAAQIPHLMITLAPEAATLAQISSLAHAGIIVALGHSDCSYDTGLAAIEAGARMVTHLFNAMSGLGHRAPGLAGATLDSDVAFGLIADGHHVHNAMLRLALAVARDRAIPVSDAMAVAGSDGDHFFLHGRRIARRGGRLTLSDGTLAGADASLAQGLCHIADATGRPLPEILPMGFDRPWRFLTGQPRTLAAGDRADLLRLDGTTLSRWTGSEWQNVRLD